MNFFAQMYAHRRTGLEGVHRAHVHAALDHFHREAASFVESTKGDIVEAWCVT